MATQIGNFLKSFDLFGHNVQLQSNNKSYFTTSIGAIVSFAIIGVFLSYSTNKFGVMIDYGDTNY